VRDPSAASFGCLPGKGGFDKANKFSDNDARMLQGTQCRQEIQKLIHKRASYNPYYPITSMGFSVMFTFQLDNTKR
jgi:hypothetical protein